MAKRRIYDDELHAQFVTFSCYHRRRALDHPRARQIVMGHLTSELAKHEGICSGFVRGQLPDYAKSFKPKDPFWQPKYYPFSLYSEKKASEKSIYMHLNPVRAGLVEKACDWRWSSARYYEEGVDVGVPIQWVF